MIAPGQKIMREAQALVVDTLAATVDDLYRQFGARKTARALVLAVWRRRQMNNHISQLSNRMRRDIGIPERLDAPAEARFSLWDIRL